MLRRLMVLVLFVAALTAAATYARDRLTLEQLADHELELREDIASHPLAAPLIGLGVYSLLSLIPGTSGKSIVFGWLFGVAEGLPIVMAGLTIAAMLTFWLSRYIVRDYVEQRFGKFISVMNRALEHDGAFYLLTLRMAHVPFSWINYCSGATRVSAWTFCWTTVLGLLPGTILFVYIGAQLPTLHELAAEGVTALIGPQLIAGLIASAFFPLLARAGYRTVRSVMHRRTAGASAQEKDCRT